MDNLKLYYETKEHEYLEEYIKEKFEEKKYYDVIVYSKLYFEEFKIDNWLIKTYLIYAYCSIGENQLAKILFESYKERVCEEFLTNQDIISIDYLFQILKSLKIGINDISFYIDNFENDYIDNQYYLEYREQLLEGVKEEKKEEFNYEQYHNYYEDDDVKIVSYNTNEDMGISTIVKDGEDVLLIDCGSKMINEKKEVMDVKKYLSDNNIKLSDIKGVLITHAHLDHYGSLNYFKNTNIPIYMTKITKGLIEKIDDEIKDIIRELSIHEITSDEIFNVDKFKITPLKNGHIIGSLAYYIETPHKTILCSGDICLHDQYTVKGLDLKQYPTNVDILLCESTYGKKEYRLKRETNEKMIAILINDAIKCGLNVFLPSFAIGRAQELISIIKQYSIDALVNVDGSAIPITKYYQKYSDVKELYNGKVKANYQSVNIDVFKNPEVYISTSGMLYSNSVFNTKYLPYVMKLDCVLIKTGYIPPNNETLISIQKNNKINFFDISLSAHAPYEDLLKFIKYVNPKVLITNHGKGIEL